MLPTFLRCFVAIQILIVISAQRLPNSEALVISELEHLYFDATGPNGFMSGLTPCTTYIDSSTTLVNNTLGRQTSGQWLRTAFHTGRSTKTEEDTDDFTTADVASGIGGIDASIGFETLRAENVGVAFNDSLFFFGFFINDKVSMADLIALGVATAIGACGGPQIPLRGGRIDATEAGPSGVPQPETEIATTLSMFSGAGFNKEDSIGLTACGHTMGGVHHSTFPQIVPESAVSVDNSGGRIAFDDTVGVFDIDVVDQYLAGTDNAGGPLVTTANKTVQSDLRLYVSDNNRTMKSLAQSPAQFASTCTDLMVRMIDTVPGGVSLTPALNPKGVALASVLLGVDWSGNMSLFGSLRYIETSGSASAPSSSTVSIIGRDGQLSKASAKAVTDLSTDTGTGIFGPTHSYPFTIDFVAGTGLSGVKVANQIFPLQDSLFIDMGLSSVSPGLSAVSNPTFGVERTWTFNITAARFSVSISEKKMQRANSILPDPKLLTSNSHAPESLTATFAIPMQQAGTISPRMDHSTALQLNAIGTAGPFTLYSAVNQYNISAKQLFGSSVDINHVDGSAATMMFFKTYDLLR